MVIKPSLLLNHISIYCEYRSSQVSSINYFSVCFHSYHSINCVQSNGVDFILVFLASNYADIQAYHPRLKFRYANNLTIVISIATGLFNRFHITFTLIFTFHQSNIIFLLGFLIVIASIILIVAAISLSVVQPKIGRCNIKCTIAVI